MPENLFTITTTPPSSLKLEVGQSGKYSFTITSLAAPEHSKEVMLVALLVTPQGKKEVDWLVPGPARTLTMSGGKTETVTITARPTSSSPVGENTIELAVADKDNPNETYVYSSPVICEVTTKAVIPPTPSTFPKWLIPVIIGGVLVLGGGAFAIWKLVFDKAPGLGETCVPTDDEPCRDNLVCSPDDKKCRMPPGATCTDNEGCDSRECVSGVCAARLGGACDPATASTGPCPKDSHCDEATKTCLKNVCTPGESQCTADGKSLSTCQANGTWQTKLCPPEASSCRDGKCQCSPDRGKVCNCSGTIQCDGSCSARPCTSNCLDGKCCSTELGKSCGKCKGIVKCDGTCSVTDPPNLGQRCGDCGGTVKCDGTCSITTPRCPPGFVVDAQNQCRSTTDTVLTRRTVQVPRICPLSREQTLDIACGANRVQGKLSLKVTPSGQTGGCGVRFATTNPTDCDVRVTLVQRSAAPLLCFPAQCEITVTTFQRRPQCVK